MTADIWDIDGFYGEPAPFDPTLEVEIELASPGPMGVVVPLAASVVSLDDDWFGSFDETKEYVVHEFDDVPTTRWQRFGEWLRAIGRAA